jgi:predicted O-methyltransferase YrrM
MPYWSGGSDLCSKGNLPFATTGPRRKQLQRETACHYHVPEERADLFHCHDGGSTEYEYLEVLKALVIALKPLNILETGTYLGYGTLAIAEAIKFNGCGRLTTIDISYDHVQETTDRLGELNEFVQMLHGDSIKFLEYARETFDFAFFDSDLFIRCREFAICLDRGLLHPGSMAAFHDTSRIRSWPEGPDPATPLFWKAFELLNVRFVEFPLSRGMVLAQVK